VLIEDPLGGEHEVGTLRAQLKCYGSADAGTRTGNECHSAGQSEIHRVPILGGCAHAAGLPDLA
jgi:hypothetical protein